MNKNELSGKSITKHLVSQQKINDEFMIMLGQLTLEELIAVKLETANQIAGNRLYGLPIFSSVKFLVEDAVVKYAISACKTKNEVMMLLGQPRKNYKKLYEKYNFDEVE